MMGAQEVYLVKDLASKDRKMENKGIQNCNLSSSQRDASICSYTFDLYKIRRIELAVIVEM